MEKTKINSLEEIEEMIADYEKKLSKLQKMSSSDIFKKQKIEISKSYLNSQLIELRAVREAKMGIKRQNEECERKIQKSNQKIKIIQQNTQALINLSNYLYSLFPNNYFLKQKAKDDFIPEDWYGIPFNVIGKYDSGNDL